MNPQDTMGGTRILITDYDFPDVELERSICREAGIACRVAQCRSAADVIDAAEGCQGLLVQYAPVNAQVFAARPEIRVVSRYGAGYDTINLDDARAFGIWVANSPDYGVGEVATHALGLTLSLLRHLHLFGPEVRAGRWHYLSTGPLQRVSNMTLGILGLGRIGKRMADLARNAFGRVIACDPYLGDADFPGHVERATLEGLFEKSNAISLHVPLNDETRGIVDRRLLGLMPSGGVLVNTARGGLVKTADLLDALDRGGLDGAALDVLPDEPPALNDPVIVHPRILCTPHAAFFSVDAERELRTKAAENLVQWKTSGRPTYVVVAGAPA